MSTQPPPTPKCPAEYEDPDSFGGGGHECRLPLDHEGDHVCMFQDDDQDYCRW